MTDLRTAGHERILVLAPAAIDDALDPAALGAAGLRCVICDDVLALAAQLEGEAGALVLTEEALSRDSVQALADALQRQPSWSDIPVLLLCGPGGDSLPRAIELLGNVMMLERPVRTTTLVSALRSSLRARRRQYDLRERMEALRQSEERFRFLSDYIPSFVWVTAPDGSLSYANEQWVEYAGLDRDDEGRSWPLAALHPEDRDFCLARWAQALREGREFELEARCRRHDGVYRWFMVRASPLKDGRGGIISWFGVTTDIHEQKQSEHAARFLADASAALGEITDYQGTLRRVAGLAVPGFADWCAVDMLKEDGTLHRLAVMHVDPARVPLAYELHRRYPRSHDDDCGPWRVAVTGRTELSSEISEDMLEQAARDADELALLRALGMRSAICVPLVSRGSVLGVISFVTADAGRRYGQGELRIAEDLARRAAVAIDNAMLYRELQDAHRRKDEFLATLAHELRNPLAPISNALQVMRLSDDESVIEQSRVIMERQTGQMVRLIDDLLDVSRITRGQFELRRERVALDAVIHNAIDTAQPLIDAAGHKLITRLPRQPVWLDADPVRLAQVFANLLNNAAKYMERGGTIWLSAAVHDGRLAVSVRDAGVGIPADALRSVFDMFMQVDRSLSRVHGGLGIGLTLVKRLVEMHGGTVEVSSEGADKGSAFTVTLPLAAAPGEDAGIAETAPPAGGSGRRRILIADDNPDVAESLAMMLRLMGNEVRAVHDGAQAIEQAVAFAPELVLLDIGMPGLDGYEVARRIREQQWDRNLVLVALTGWGQEEDRRRSIDAGFDHHFTKPVNPAVLERLIARLPRAQPLAAQLDIDL
jgi:PAS domain S-box-containing protein